MEQQQTEVFLGDSWRGFALDEHLMEQIIEYVEAGWTVSQERDGDRVSWIARRQPPPRVFHVTGQLPDGDRLEHDGEFQSGCDAVIWAIERGACRVTARLVVTP